MIKGDYQFIYATISPSLHLEERLESSQSIKHQPARHDYPRIRIIAADA